MSQQQPQPQFSIQRLYIKDASFESPQAPQIFLQEWQPQLDLHLDTQANEIDPETREVILTVTVTVKVSEKVAFLAEVKQAGIFTVKGFAAEQLPQVLGAFCPNILYPYACEAISNLVAKGGFPPLYLSPVNFEALLADHQQKQGPTNDEKAVH